MKLAFAHNKNIWLDFTDPCSGYPVHSQQSNTIYPDVDATCSLLSYNSLNVGCCSLIQHPTWATRNYPATIFISGATPLEIDGVIRNIAKHLIVEYDS